jgi:hypothetical protein
LAGQPALRISLLGQWPASNYRAGMKTCCWNGIAHCQPIQQRDGTFVEPRIA